MYGANIAEELRDVAIHARHHFRASALPQSRSQRARPSTVSEVVQSQVRREAVASRVRPNDSRLKSMIEEEEEKKNVGLYINRCINV